MAKAEPIRVSVCIPAYNEQEIIRDTVAEAVEVLRELPGRHEILVCDDGSSDATGQILRDLSDTEPLLVPIFHDRNMGNAVAQKTLVRAARGEVIFHIGADREWRMRELVRMLAKLDEGYDIVIGVRTEKAYSPARRLVSWTFNTLVCLMWGKHFGDLGSIKLARADLWKRLPFSSTSAFLHAERILVAYSNGARISTVPVEHFPRTTGESKFADPRQAVRAFGDLLKFRLSRRSRTRVEV